MFLELGPAASTNEIARRIGLSQAALFKRFGTKSDLMVRALAPPHEPPFLDALASGPSEEPLAPQLHAIGRRIASYFSEIVPCMAVLRAGGFDMQHILQSYDVPPPVRAQAALGSWLQQAQALGHIRADVDVHSTALVFLGALQSRAFLAHLLGSVRPVVLPDDDYIDHLVDVLCRGILCEEAA